MGRWLEWALALGAGALFGVGLVLGGMTEPTKVIGFLDVLGAWDPSLGFVMLGAVGVHGVFGVLVRKRSSPLWAPRFRLPTRRDIDTRLLAGSAVFGVGWALAGYCPGPAVVSVAGGGIGILIFVGFMAAGMLGTAKVDDWYSRRLPPSSAEGVTVTTSIARK
jgi:uncharacterized protein